MELNEKTAEIEKERLLRQYGCDTLDQVLETLENLLNGVKF